MTVSPVVVLAAGALGAVIVARLIVREWQRINDELARVRTAPVPNGRQEAIPRLRRDPKTGIYRP